MNYRFSLAALWLGLLAPVLHSFSTDTKLEQINATQLRLEIVCTLDPDELLFHNSVQFSSNMPSVVISKWYALKEPHTFLIHVQKNLNQCTAQA